MCIRWTLYNRIPKSKGFLRNWASFKLSPRVDFPPRVKGLTYCIKYIWLVEYKIFQCKHFNDKTLLDVRFCDHYDKAVFILLNSDCKIYILGTGMHSFKFWYLGYGHWVILAQWPVKNNPSFVTQTWQPCFTIPWGHVRRIVIF